MEAMENMTNEFKRQVFDAIVILLAPGGNPISGPHEEEEVSNKAGARNKYYIIRCEHKGCKKEVKKKRPDSRFCGENCRQQAYAARKKAAKFKQAHLREVIELITQL